MANMFKETAKHVKPISVEDSIKTDRVIDNLWIWCSRLETLGVVLFVILVIIGIIASIISGFQVVDISYSGNPVYEFNFGMFCLTLLDYALYAFIEYCTYHVIALLIGALASITQNTKATARLLEYQASANELRVQNEWKCEKCGKINSDYVETCSCGNTKEKNNTNATSQRYCEKCGAKIADNVIYCPCCSHKQTSEENDTKNNYNKTTSQRYCENCGAKIADNIIYCHSCGHKQTSKVYL